MKEPVILRSPTFFLDDVRIPSFLFIIIRHSRMLQSGIQIFSVTFGPLIETFRGDERKGKEK